MITKYIFYIFLLTMYMNINLEYIDMMAVSATGVGLGAFLFDVIGLAGKK